MKQDPFPGTLLDVGCNTGYLLQELGFGWGVDASYEMVRKCRDNGQLHIQHAWAEDLPYRNKSVDIVVLSCILEQTTDWRIALAEAKRVGKKVIGINPFPGSTWGKLGGWVKSIIAPEYMGADFIIPVDNERYYFEITYE